jgi:NodT family efflux transporter outer membrane factor (OMF) lipoprotein
VKRVAWLGLLLAGCSIPQSRPEVQPLVREELGLADGASAPAVRLDWWRAYGDPQLDRLVADALADSPTLDAAIARVRQANAVLSRQDAERGPSADLDAQLQAARLSGRYTIPPPYAGTVRVQGIGQAGLDWNLDLFGRQRAAIEQAAGQRDAAAFDAAATRVMIASSMVQAYAEIARAERQMAIARQTVDTREASLRLTQARVRSKLASDIDTTGAQTLVAQAKVALARAEGARTLATQAVAALAGRGTDYATGIGPTNLSAPGPDVPADLPADLLSRRADIAAAQARARAAAAGRQVARRAFYPNVNLSAFAGIQAIGIGNLLSLDAGTGGGGAAIHLPLFDNGRLKADLAGATAGLDLATANYNEAVVAAVREAADAIARLQAIAREREAQRAAVAGLAKLGQLNAVRVRAGLNSRLDLIDTDIRLLDARQAEENLAIDAIVARAQLAQALGGGFESESQP